MIIGLDVGGTHIDAVIIKDKQLIKVVKEPYEKEQLEKHILKTLNLLLTNIKLTEIKQINLSTTISTNAIVLNKINRVGMIIQNGPGLPNKMLKLTPDFFFIDGYTDHRGMVVKNYQQTEILHAKDYFKSQHINNIGIATKFSTRNPKTEQLIKKSLIDYFPTISLSHELSGRLNFKRRINTTYLNAAIYDIYKDFCKTILASLKEKEITAPVYILKADGGIISLKESIKKPVETILSGPAASLNGFLGHFDLDGDGILLDIGGTTTDIFVVASGLPLFEPLGIEIKHYKTLIRSIFSKSIGLGGDSSIIAEDGKIKIGPNREGKPYSLGGPKLTITDVFIYQGKLNIGSKNKAFEVLNIFAEKLKLTVPETAEKIIETFTENLKIEVDKIIKSVNSKPIYTIKELLHPEKIKPQFIKLIGGPAKLLSENIEKAFNLKCCYQKNYQVANAIGASLSKITGEINLHIDTEKRTLIIPELGLVKEIEKDVTLTEARKLALSYLNSLMTKKGHSKKDDLEIVFESSFNMIDGFYTKGKNIRIKAQVKPGLIYKLIGDKNEE